MGLPTKVAERYDFRRVVSNGTGGLLWIAFDLEAQKHVVIRLVSREQSRRLEPLVGFKQRHLAGILELIPRTRALVLPEPRPFEAGDALAVAEFVPGLSLAEQLESARVLPAKAVAWAVRLLELLAAVHERGAVLGHLSPHSVLAKSAGRAVAPVVSSLLYPPLAPYCSLARILGEEPSPEDDVWALSATLYAAITGKPAYAGATPAELKTAFSRGTLKTLRAHGIDEPSLDEILKQALLREARGRLSRLGDLARVLDDWERDPTAPPKFPAGAPKSVRRAALAAPGAATDVLFDLSGLSSRVSFLPTEGGALHGMSTPPPPVTSNLLDFQIAPGQTERPSKASPLTRAPGSSPRASEPAASQHPPTSRSSITPVPALTARANAVSAARAPAPGARPSVLPPAVVGSAIRGFARGSTAPPAPKAQEKSVLEELQARAVWLAATAALLGVIVILVWDRARGPYAPGVSSDSTASPSSEALEDALPGAPRDREACIAQHFKGRPKGSDSSVSFVCSGGDFRGITLRLHRLLGGTSRTREAVSSDAGSESAEPLGSLGWYELPATAIVRRNCCNQDDLADLPKSTGPCEQLGAVVSVMAQSLASDADMTAAANRFDLAASCLVGRRESGAYGYSAPPTAQNRRAFQSFIERARAAIRR